MQIFFNSGISIYIFIDIIVLWLHLNPKGKYQETLKAAI